MPVPGMPPSMSPAPANVGPVATPQGNQGNSAQAMSLIRNAIEMFQKALPMIPMGSPLHGDILNATSKISKHMEESGGANKGVDIQSLLQMAKSASQQSPVQALNRMHPSPTAAPAMPTPAPAAAE